MTQQPSSPRWLPWQEKSSGPSKIPSVVIVGGGISGLCTAYYLARAGIPSTLIERQPRLGGVIQTEIIEGCLLEGGPDSFLSAKPWAMELIHDLGLARDVVGSNDHLRVTYVRKNGRLVPLPDGLMLMVPTRIMPVALSRLLGMGTKIRMGREFFRRPSGGLAPDRSVADFIRDHYGEEAVDYLAEPLLAGVYGGDPEELSVSSVLARFVELEQQYGSLTRGVLAERRKAARETGSQPLFRTLRGGLGTLIDVLVRASTGPMKVIEASAEAVGREGGRFRVRVNGGAIEADHVVLACQAYQAGALIRPLDPKLANLLESIPYHSSVTVALAYDRSSFDRGLNGFGFLVPKRERRRVIACTWVGTKFPDRVPEGKELLRCFLGGGDEAVIDQSDEDLVACVREELRDIMGVTAEPLFTHIARWPRSMAQYTVGHQQRVEAIETRLELLPGLSLAGNAYYGIGIPDCVRMGKVAAEKIVSSRH